MVGFPFINLILGIVCSIHFFYLFFKKMKYLDGLLIFWEQRVDIHGFKETVSVISRDPTYKDGNARFTKGTIVNRVFPFFHEGSLEIMLTFSFFHLKNSVN